MHRLDELESVYRYQGSQTCAADGMCQVKCPVKINTGEMIKHLRAEKYDDSKPSEYARVSTLLPCCSRYQVLCQPSLHSIGVC